MSLITTEVKNNIFYIQLHGRIDSSNAAPVEEEILDAVGSCTCPAIVVDADDLAYISSAGLRVILRLRKTRPELKIINASSAVYEIFEMTGFTEMIPVEKGYRKLSIEGCEVIGQGANGKVYRLDKDTIVKVYYKADALPEIRRERELARRAFILGIPTAIPYDVAKVGDSYGSVFELLNAKSFSKLIAAEPENLDMYVGLYVDLLKKIHSTEVKPDDMPDQRAVVIDWVNFLKDYLDADKWEKLHKMVEAVPVNHHMIHGDYHTKNVMMQNGEVLLIDMDTLSQGDPVFEFASIYNAFVGFYDFDHNAAVDFQGLDYDTTVSIWKKMLPLYFGTTDPAALKAVEDKSAIIGYSRLMRRLIRRNGLDTEEGRKLIAHYKNQIETRLDSVDTLQF
ncbi:MAG: anti-sigma factor antagonist [Spirochaetia bacterium]|nr:anti-sigma factor antagonist [Spirochaetia bacterium]